jgi:hypothetical protein
MATLDETNIFGLPLTRQYGLEPKPAPAPMSEQEQANRQEFESRIGSDNKFGLTYEGFLKAKEKKLVSDQRMQVAQALAEGDTDKAYEGFTELPMVTDQFPAYMTPVLGNIIDEKERRYFAEKAGRELKDPRDVELEMLMASDPRDVKQFTTQDPVSGAMSTLAGVSSLIGIGEGPTMLKAGIMGAFPSLRKGMTAKTMDGQGGGGIGGLSKQEFTQKEIDTKARDGMFISPLNRYLITTAPKNLKGQALLDHIKANQSKGGYKADEIRYTGIEEYLKENPEATTQELIDYASENKPRIVVETLGDEADSQDIFLPERVEPIDPISGQDHSISRAKDILNDIKKGESDIFDADFIEGVDAFEGMDFSELYYNAYANSKISKKQYETLMGKLGVSNPGLLPADMVKTSQDALENQKPLDNVRREGLLEELAEEIDKYNFYNNPYKLIELDEGVGVDLKAYGNDDVGYVLIQDGERVELEGDVRIGTAGEAQNQMKILLRDQGEAYNMSGIDGEVEFKGYVLNKTMPHVNGKNYQEMKLLMPSLEARGFKTFKGHYNEDYEIGTLAKVDSKLDDGSATMHIPEFQADVHQKGASTGYDTPKRRKYYDEVLIPQAVKDFEAQAKRILGDDEFNRLKTLYADEYNVDDGFLPPEKQYKARDHFVLKKISDKIKSNYRVTPSTWYDYAQLDTIMAKGLAPEYPHQEYVPAVVKQMVAKAIDEGKDTISFPTSTSILERTGKKPRKVGNIEVAQVSAPTELDKQTYELAKNTEDLETQFTVNPEFPNEQNIYFGNMENVIEHIVDLKSMDRKLKQFPDVDFSSPNTRRQYLDFEITMYRDTLDDPAFNVQALDDFARSYEQKLNELGYEIVERADPTVNPKLQELYDEYPDGVKRSMEADALESTQPLTAKALREGYSHNDFNDLLYNKNTNTFTTGKSLENDALAKITSQGEFVIRDPSLEDIGGAAIKPYATYQSIERAFGSSVAKQIRKLAEEGKIPQSYGSYFYDLADGNRNYNSARLSDTFEKTLPYSLDVNKTIGGEKFITDYDKKIPSELKKIAKDYGGKFEEGKLDAEAVYGSKLNLEGEDLNTFMPDKRLGVNILRITPEMKAKVIKEGMSSMYKGGIVNKVKSMDKPIQGNRREM